MLLNIRHIETKLGMAPLGESRILRVRNYLKLNSQIAELEALRNSYHGKV